MASDELVYSGVIAASIPVGFLFRYLSPRVKQVAALVTGLSVTIVTCQIHTLHSLVTVIGTWVIIKNSWRHAPVLSLSWTFLYLLFFRLIAWFNLPSPTPFANAIQLLLTLKMVSIANEVHSFHAEKKKELSSSAESVVGGGLSQEPSLFDVLCYSYCYIGIMTGPFFRFQTYVDWLRQPRPLDLPGWLPCLQRLKLVPVYGALFLAVQNVFPLVYVRTEEFLEENILFRFFYMVAVFFVFRMRFYAAWCGAEAGCISAGLGCYPEKAQAKPGGGPTVKYSPDSSAEEMYNFRTIQNIDCYKTDFCVKVRHGMHYWNMTVQWWLHQYIYSNAPFKAYTLRAAWTMFISAYWHGLHAGYYLSFLTIPLCIAAETAMEGSVRAKLGPLGQNVFDWIHWFLKMRAYDYMCMGFVLLQASDTINYWSSIYFIMHVIALCCIVLGRALKGGKSDGKTQEKRAEKQNNMKGRAGEKMD
ncbi:lysophospholipid acyltransferase 7 [Thalassophryne amazonica]|uniref:lysophospholipid acyltransferase 7 n=1 Tax=Thalassophryne amazonica TaxID=390379 RepID=UPI0014723E26|nr:lysophospholipid acyltransferase 7 [Thalassophryne amazonica]XP_034030569.1 lysophospholipid acyltransferase 7 [Thalassophryne amazonica]XP_034030570.1 lysophospholipid acyltransferase 7 [Thalassophryne amazonica]XP_034030571.1 lysophospholipid acyltransferase 7 [Thalassophryne amazonica]